MVDKTPGAKYRVDDEVLDTMADSLKESGLPRDIQRLIVADLVDARNHIAELERYAKVGKLAERWYRAKTALEKQADRPNDPPESYFERYENAERRLVTALEDLKIDPGVIRLLDTN